MPSNVQPPRGMRDFLPSEKAQREHTLAIIRGTYEKFGYREIETPFLEDLDRLMAGEGGDNEKLIFKVLRRGLDLSQVASIDEVADLGLRYDLTLPLARFYATNRTKLPSVTRTIQVGAVWRAERPQKGRFRQFTQCDIDVIGEPGAVAEIELIAATLAALEALSIQQCAVRLNDRRVLHAMLRHCGFAEGEFGRVLISVDKLDKIGVDGVADELSRGGYESGSVDSLTGLLSEYSERGGGLSVEQVVKLLPGSTDAAVLDNLQYIAEAVGAAWPSGNVVFDPTLVRGMGYYTGPIFEVDHPSSSSSIAGGGRYDGMIGRFTGEDIPACGFSIGFERIVGLARKAVADADRSVALMYDAEVSAATLVGLQSQLVTSGYKVRLVRRPKKMARSLDSLADEGYMSFAVVDRSVQHPDDLDFRDIGAG
jgi:histidyl-tRNA synthetase